MIVKCHFSNSFLCSVISVCVSTARVWSALPVKNRIYPDLTDSTAPTHECSTAPSLEDIGAGISDRTLFSLSGYSGVLRMMNCAVEVSDYHYHCGQELEWEICVCLWSCGSVPHQQVFTTGSTILRSHWLMSPDTVLSLVNTGRCQWDQMVVTSHAVSHDTAFTSSATNSL